MSRITTALCLWCMMAAASLVLLLQPASSFPLERLTSSSAQHQSISVLSHHAHDEERSSEKDSQQQQRRQVLQRIGLSALSLPFWGLATTTLPARAAAADAAEITVATATARDPATAAADRTFVRRTDQYSYQFTPPPHFTPGNKPLKTHLDENNFKSADTSGFQFGITVDPVRLQSLAEFGTPGEVAAKVVTAEVNRDGVFDVKLMDDPIEQKGDSAGSGADGSEGEEGTSSGLVLDYLSSGKRGDKRFIAKFFVQKGKLYVLTAQCKQADYETVKAELLEAVDSFRVLATTQ
jgi:hypothetical protein